MCIEVISPRHEYSRLGTVMKGELFSSLLFVFQDCFGCLAGGSCFAVFASSTACVVLCWAFVAVSPCVAFAACLFFFTLVTFCFAFHLVFESRC